MQSVKEEVGDAQGALLAALADCEDQVGATYEAFAVAFPGDSAFWNQLADEEHDHCRRLKNLRIFLVSGHLFSHIGRFTAAEVQHLQHLLAQINQKLKASELSMAESYASALKLECTLVDGRFYKVVGSDAPEYAAFCIAMVAESNQHILRIHAAYRKNSKERLVDPWAKVLE